MQGVFVFDCVVHAYNMDDSNLLDRPDAQLGRDSIVGLGARTRAPANQDLYPTFAKDWSLEELEDMVFGRSVTDLAMAQTVPIFDWFKDGFAPVKAQYEFASAYPDRVLFCGGVDPSYHGAAALDEMQRQVEEMGARSFKFYNAHIDGKVVAVGLNYLGQAAEQQQRPPSEPLVFAKLPSAVVGHGAEIVWGPALARQVDAEAELAVVIGRRARHVSVADPLDHVLGYTACNDVSARDLQAADGQWVRAKSLDTFCPMGPVLVAADEISDPSGLRIECTVNGTPMQSASTADMHFSVSHLISWCSASFTLEPGDVIATGTPPGVGIYRDPPRLLADGDEVVVEIERIGRLANRCRHRPAP